MKLDQILQSLPEIQAGRGIWQNQFHEFDVYEHSIDFVRHVKKLTDDRNIIAAGYLHDIGKPVVAKPKYREGVLLEREAGKPYHTFENHEKVGEEMVREMNPRLLENLSLNQDRVASLVGCHYLPMKGIKSMRKAANYDDFMHEYQKLEKTLHDSSVSKEDILTMFLADKLAQGEYCTDRNELFAIRDALIGKKKDLQIIYDMQRENKI